MKSSHQHLYLSSQDQVLDDVETVNESAWTKRLRASRVGLAVATGTSSATALSILGLTQAANISLGTSATAKTVLLICTAIPVAGWVAILAASTAYLSYELGVSQAKKTQASLPVTAESIADNAKTCTTSRNWLIGSSLGLAGGAALAMFSLIPIAGWVLLAVASIALIASAYSYGKSSYMHRHFKQLKIPTTAVAKVSAAPQYQNMDHPTAYRSNVSESHLGRDLASGCFDICCEMILGRP